MRSLFGKVSVLQVSCCILTFVRAAKREGSMLRNQTQIIHRPPAAGVLESALGVVSIVTLLNEDTKRSSTEYAAVSAFNHQSTPDIVK